MNMPHPISHGHHKPKKNMKHYLLITTMVIAAIFLVLLINENSQNPTGAVISVKDLGGIGESIIEGTAKVVSENSPKSTEVKVNSEEAVSRSFSMTVNKIPITSQEDVTVGLIDIGFTDVSTQIHVNNELLGLRDLSSISLSLSDFSGNVAFNEVGFSLDGSVQQLIVNGVTLSTSDSIAISFNDLNYDALSLTDATINSLSVSQSKGFMVIEERLSYKIDDDLISLGSFTGSALFNRVSQESMSLVGLVDGLSVEGGLLVGIQ